MNDRLNRKEFEETLKRALDIQSSIEDETQESYSLQDLRNASDRLNLSPEALSQALLEVKRKNRQYTLSGSKEKVKENFLTDFLMKNSAENIFSGNLKVDRSSLLSCNIESLRVYHPHFSEIDAEVTFQDDGEDSTIVSWKSNKSLSWRTTILGSVIPLIFIFSVVLSFSGAAIIIATDTLLISLAVSFIFFLTYLYERQQIEKILMDYFENTQAIDKVKELHGKEKELLLLREWKKGFEQTDEAETRIFEPNKNKETS